MTKKTRSKSRLREILKKFMSLSSTDVPESLSSTGTKRLLLSRQSGPSVSNVWADKSERSADAPPRTASFTGTGSGSSRSEYAAGDVVAQNVVGDLEVVTVRSGLPGAPLYRTDVWSFTNGYLQHRTRTNTLEDARAAHYRIVGELQETQAHERAMSRFREMHAKHFAEKKAKDADKPKVDFSKRRVVVKK